MLMLCLGNEAHGGQEEGKQEGSREARKDGSHVVQFHCEPQRDTGWGVGMAPKAFFGELTGETVPDLSRNTLALLAGISGE